MKWDFEGFLLGKIFGMGDSRMVSLSSFFIASPIGALCGLMLVH